MVTAHEKPLRHKQAKQESLAQRDMETAQKQQSESTQLFTEDLLKVLYFLVSHNLPLHLYGSLIQLARELGDPNLTNHCGRNATYQSWDTAQGLIQQLSSEVNARVQAETDSSPHFSCVMK